MKIRPISALMRPSLNKNTQKNTQQRKGGDNGIKTEKIASGRSKQTAFLLKNNKAINGESTKNI
jgi:hypothetical protein